MNVAVSSIRTRARNSASVVAMRWARSRRSAPGVGSASGSVSSWLRTWASTAAWRASYHSSTASVARRFWCSSMVRLGSV
ncbi:hypothetical protein ACFFX0_24060 [Citricoccus parietis]|uniref:Uncharacterized protein n=1 Tax=Citricoccus parietis TaxID=592307 RepID=A0ABV5G573_9MICC